MTFQVLDAKEWHFLDLLDNGLNYIKPLYAKDGPWLNFFGYSNSLCVRASRAIVNHAPIEEYCLRFFPKEEFKCLCGLYPIELRRHILHNCIRYNNYWNLRQNIIFHFILFLEFNSSAFSFGEGIT